MKYKETLDYLYTRLPMFTKVGASAIKKGLDNIIAFCELLENPQNKFKTIHVAGTNGKGSTSHMLAAILQVAGYKTGLYTSPHLRDFRERIKINGEMISEKEVVDFVAQQSAITEKLSPSFFEVTVAMAFEIFAQQEVDIAVIEVGLGGRLDSTNIIFPELSLITNIGYDHVDILGKTLAEIAGEKAGIIKKDTPVIIGEYLPETLPVFKAKALAEDAPLFFAADEVSVATKDRTNDLFCLNAKTKNESIDVALDLTATYQIKNIKAVLLAVYQLRKKGYNITDEHIKTALKQVKTLTGLMGRWQTLQSHPLVICDTGHNEDGIKEVLKNIGITDYKNLHIVIGMVKDKDISKVLSLLPQNATYYFCAPKLERAKSAEDLAKEAQLLGLLGEIYTSVEEAKNAAIKNAAPNDLVFIGGSTFVVAEIV